MEQHQVDPTSGLSIVWHHHHLQRHHKEPWQWRVGALSYVQQSAHVRFDESVVILNVQSAEATSFATALLRSA